MLEASVKRYSTARVFLSFLQKNFKTAIIAVLKRLTKLSRNINFSLVKSRPTARNFVKKKHDPGCFPWIFLKVLE